MNIFKENIEAVIPKVKAWRQHIHKYPEPSFEEFKTTEYIIDQIKDFADLKYARVSPTGIVVRLETGKPGPVIALRADIDALKMTENSGVEFASCHEGVMHACGHDTHTSMLLGALHVMYERRAELEGTFVFLFQAAEENFPGGAKELVEKGVLDDVDAIVGQHVGVNLKVGQIGTRPGYLMANSDEFEITFIGRGGHGSSPHLCLDPLVVAAQVVTALQNLVSRHLAAKDSGVLSVTQFNSGTAYNIIPDTATIRGTVRTYTKENRAFFEQMMGQIVEKYAAASDLEFAYKYNKGYGTLYNTPELTKVVMEVADELYGSGTAQTINPSMGAEDFSYYLEKVPGVFYFLGVRNEELNCIYPTHNTKFRVDEEAFSVGISVMINTALRFQKVIKEGQGGE